MSRVNPFINLSIYKEEIGIYGISYFSLPSSYRYLDRGYPLFPAIPRDCIPMTQGLYDDLPIRKGVISDTYLRVM
jgi:hypothetical protein